MNENELNNKNKIAETAYFLGFEYHKKYGVCSQCVLAAIQDTVGIISNDVIKSAHPLAGGVARGGDGTCGSLLGGVIALSCEFGRGRNEFDTKPIKPFELTRNLRQKFIQEYGDTSCHNVQKKLFDRTFDFWSETDRIEFNKINMGKHSCHEVVGNVAKWVIEILSDEGRANPK